MSPSQRPRTSAARRARSRRPTDGRWRVGGAGCGGAGPRAAAARVEGESGFESARGRAAPTSGRSPSRATAGSASRSGRFVARCVAPSSANGARQSGHRMQPSTPPVDACARAREAQRARHVAAGRARGCDGRGEADGALLGRENRSAAGRRRRARIVPRQRGRRRRPFEMTVRPVVARAHVPGARRGRVHPVQVLARRPLVADPPAAAVAQDAEPTAVDVPPPRGVVLCAAASIDAIRPRVARPGDEDFAVGRWSARHGRRHGPEKPIVVSSFE